MNPQLIAAFHQYESFNDIIDNTDISSRGFEKLIIGIIRDSHKLPIVEPSKSPKIDIAEPKVNFEESPKIETTSDAIDLSEEQLDFIEKANDGENIFLTAAAGFGKSASIHEAVKQLRAKYDKPNEKGSKVAICASTGCASKLISGKTLHSFLGIGLAKNSPDELYERLITTRRLKPKYMELKNLKVLIIDEISMINNVLFDKVSRYLELIKDNMKVFGGVQVIVIGDLHQMPPVEGKYFFESLAYKDGDFNVIQLTKCFRQDNIEFQQILSEARVGNLSAASYKTLLQQNSIHEKFGNIKPTILCSTNREVDAINQKELSILMEETNASLYTYRIKNISTNQRKIDMVLKMESIPTEIDLCIGAQIMITTNISTCIQNSIVNGSQGVILEIYPNYAVVKLIDIEEPVKIAYQKILDPDCDADKNPIYLCEYMPFRLCWAITIHRIQGQSVSVLEINLGKVFTFSQGYVAISRIRSLEGLKINSVKKSSFKADPKVIEFYETV